MRFLFYASNGLGIGHLTRLLNVAQALSKASPSSEILFLTQSEAAPFPDTCPFYAIRIPGRNRARTGGLTAKSYLQTVRPLILQAVASFDPHVLVTDTFPEGPEKELSPTMDWPIHKAFIFREQHVRRAEDPYLHQVLRRYHRILVPHDKDSVPLPSFLKSDPRLSWTGPVLPADPLFSREESRKRLGIPEHRETLLLSFGGGGDPEAKQRAKNIAAFLRARNQSFFYASGPLARSLPEGIHAGEWLPLWPIRPYLKAFDGIVASGGYNTVHEVLESRIPAFLCDFPRALDPQADRIDRLVREGRVMTHSGQTLSGLLSSLETFLEKRTLLSESLQTQSAPVSSGADTAARILLNILQPA
ncbi:hypothetical protein LptCag_0799 [Leptospirillum ferriphilum]|uniref:Glycosyl transferase family 28 C-terminal domain-containing protein n=1 Tax=Leptospirillum ferriphilum TaxID=178606 RepID=A0A094W9H3_9BACT|nr:hypothetical protein [Leptospirillum ferriphilum]KGA94173.1 hypothetical protein LptCag_0799 [Leptospirillum ferriphilum]